MSCTDKDIDGSYYYARVNAVNVSDNPVDVSHGYEYYFDVNETHTMLNWVYEEHYNKATVKCKRIYSLFYTSCVVRLHNAAS